MLNLSSLPPLSLSLLAACLHFNPTPHLSPSLSRPGDGRGVFFFCFLPGTHMVPGLPGVTARLEEKIVARLLPLRPRNLLRVGGREQTLACVSV